MKVGEPHELPPGKGKTTIVAGHEVTVYNREGRYIASVTTTENIAAGVVETTCEMPGHTFDLDTGPAATPDRLRTDASTCEVQVEDDGIYVVISS